MKIKRYPMITKEKGVDTYALRVDHPAKAKRVLACYMREDKG